MLDILKYIFSGFWIFWGSIIILCIIGGVICSVVGDICRTIVCCRSVKHSKDNDIKIE